MAPVKRQGPGVVRRQSLADRLVRDAPARALAGRSIRERQEDEMDTYGLPKGLSRRDFGKFGLALVPAAALAGTPSSAFGMFIQGRPNSVFGGVPIGMIGNLGTGATDPASLAASIAQIGLSSVELGNGPLEAFAGAPAAPGRAGGAGGRGAAAPAPGAPAAPPAAGQPPAAGRRQGAGAGRGRAQMTPEQEAEQRAHAVALRTWRATAPMDKCP